MHDTVPKRAVPVPAAELNTKPLPRRVRSVLLTVYEAVSDELERGLLNTLAELEQQLYKLADQARSEGVQASYFGALRSVRTNGALLLPALLRGVDNALATLREPPAAEARQSGPKLGQLSLVEDLEIEEAIVIKEIAGRAEIRHSLPLYLLGQRFGVLAGRPAFDAENLPIGPTRLARLLQSAATCLDLAPDYRQMLFRQFDRSFLQFIGPFYEAMNVDLVRQGILPNLTFVPIRARPTAQNVSAATAGRSPPATAPSLVAAEAPPPVETVEARRQSLFDHAPLLSEPQPKTRWPGLVEPGDEAQHAAHDREIFDVLRQLLASRRSLVGKLSGRSSGMIGAELTADPAELQGVLESLQRLPDSPVMRNGRANARSIADLKQDLLMSLRAGHADGAAVALSDEDSDTIDLVGLLLDHLLKSLNPSGPAAGLLTRLQIPLLRVALADKGFFTRATHPARRLLNAVAETGAFFNADDENDRPLFERMQQLVDRAASDFQGDPALFETLLDDITGHLQTLVRKAEVAERRHVDAARGKEKLELARIQAAEAIDRALIGKRVPKFLANLLAQSWSDVLALTLLRQGENSDAFRHQLHIAERLIESAQSRRTTGSALISPAEAQTLREAIAQALRQVGYHDEDALAVATRLLAFGNEDEEDDPASRTELAMRLKQRPRFGQEVEQTDAARAAPLSDEENNALEQLKRLPFGTWMELIGADGTVTRRRLSWFSPVTGTALFINHRGQRVAEQHLHQLARDLAAGRLRIVMDSRGSLVDSAWQAIVNALRSFAPKTDGGTA